MSWLFPFGRLLHLLGIALALGGLAGAAILLAKVRGSSDSARPGLLAALDVVISKVEVPGLLAALAAGIVLVVANPSQLSASESGAGPWLHIKLVMVMALVVLAHLKMFAVRGAMRAEQSSDADAALAKASTLSLVSLLLGPLILILVVFRYAIFG